MVGTLIDLTGQRFGRLTVIGRAENDQRGLARWLCKCDCGNEKVIRGDHLRKGCIQSCGCWQREIERESGLKTRTHGMTKTRPYRIWIHMRSRCYDKKCHAYNRYGGRGITVCEEWRNDFQAFYDWAISHGYSDDLSIDRIDNDKGYSPDNCRWATAKEQNKNRRKWKRIKKT